VSSVRRVPLVLITVVFLGLLVPTGAVAHIGSIAPAVDAPQRLEVPTTILRAGPPAVTPLFLLFGLASGLLVALAARWQPRRVLVLALVALLALFVVEAGIHSVHHLGERAAATCAIAVAAGHLTLCLDDGPPVVSCGLTPAGVVAEEHVASPAAPGRGLDLARAPPAPIA
jgi:hypothetical protein